MMSVGASSLYFYTKCRHSTNITILYTTQIACKNAINKHIDISSVDMTRSFVRTRFESLHSKYLDDIGVDWSQLSW